MRLHANGDLLTCAWARRAANRLQLETANEFSFDCEAKKKEKKGSKSFASGMQFNPSLARPRTVVPNKVSLYKREKPSPLPRGLTGRFRVCSSCVERIVKF